MRETSRADDKKLRDNNNLVSANKINVLHNYFPTKEVANTIQRAGRISRTAVGKSYAIVYDYIHDHPIFIYQFYNRNKRNYRLKAYLQCTQVDEVVEELVRYMQSIARGKPLNKKHFKLLNENYDQVVVHIDEMPHLEIDD